MKKKILSIGTALILGGGIIFTSYSARGLVKHISIPVSGTTGDINQQDGRDKGTTTAEPLKHGAATYSTTAGTEKQTKSKDKNSKKNNTQKKHAVHTTSDDYKGSDDPGRTSSMKENSSGTTF